MKESCIRVPKWRFRDFAKIGEDTFHRESYDIAVIAFGILMRSAQNFARHGKFSIGDMIPIIKRMPQEGKTEVMIIIGLMFAHTMEMNDLSYQLILTTALPDVALTSQTRKRVYSAKSYDGKKKTGAYLHVLLRAMKDHEDRNKSYDQDAEPVIVCNRNKAARLPDLLPKTGVDCRLILVDEVHSGNGSSSCLNRMFSGFGALPHKAMHSWESSNDTCNLIVGVSATPFAHELRSSSVVEWNDPILFTMVSGRVSDKYCGIMHMRKSNRIHQVCELTANGELTPWAKRLLLDSRNGYILVREQGKKHCALIAALKRYRLKVIEIDGILIEIGDELTNLLTVPPNKPTIVVIRGTARAGISFDCTKHIKCVIEMNSKNTDTVVQSLVGRCCGYYSDLEHTKLKKDDSFPIYANVMAVDEYIAYCNKTGNNPSGVGVKRRLATKKVSCTLYSFDTPENNIARVKKNNGGKIPSYARTSVSSYKYHEEDLMRAIANGAVVNRKLQQIDNDNNRPNDDASHAVKLLYPGFFEYGSALVKYGPTVVANTERPTNSIKKSSSLAN